VTPEYHRPVLLQEVLDLLITDPDGCYLDATVGGGGHAAAILSKLSDRGRLIGLDRDPAAIQAASESLVRHRDRVRLVPGLFWDLGAILDGLNIAQVDGVLFDLGVSSRQIDDPDRGFSYRHDGPLDMRMGGGRSAREIVNSASRGALLRIFREYGEERRAAAIASAICARRERAPILSTGDLASVVRSAIPPDHPQKTLARIFQAIRIEVNEELERLPDALAQATGRLGSGGRIGVIAYHSLEDRAVKTAFDRGSRRCTCPADFPICRCGGRAVLRLVAGRRGIRPRPEEVAANPRARSATLRIAEKI
jgi:16S rRNA (cytosine1402-N4)-methyltransferase